MRACPHCGGDLSVPRRLVATSAKELVEGLELDAAKRSWCVRKYPGVNCYEELDDFKIRMRANGYKVGKNLVKDGWAAFQYHMKQAARFSKPKSAPKPDRTFRQAAKKVE